MVGLVTLGMPGIGFEIVTVPRWRWKRLVVHGRRLLVSARCWTRCVAYSTRTLLWWEWLRAVRSVPRMCDGLTVRSRVLSTAPAVDQLRKAASALRRARRRGLPVPGYEGVVETSQGAAVLQQRLPGRTPDRVDDALIDRMLNVNDRFRGLLASRCYLHAPDLYLTASGPGVLCS